MLLIEIPTNANCEATERVFHDLEPPRRITHVRLSRAPGGRPMWHAVTGWTLDGATAPALARKVDDSGDGVAMVISGGDAGLRFRPEGSLEPWRVEAARQWGLPFVLLPDAADLRYDSSSG